MLQELGYEEIAPLIYPITHDPVLRVIELGNYIVILEETGISWAGVIEQM